MLAHVLHNVQTQSYGRCHLDITGPRAVAAALYALAANDMVAIPHHGIFRVAGQRVALGYLKSTAWEVLTRTHTVVGANDDDADAVLVTKFLGYYQLMQSSTTPYRVLYDARRVFRNPHDGMR
jgi:hypothetical protein